MIHTIESLVRLSEDRVRCRVFRDTGPFEFTVCFETFEPSFRGFNLEGPSPREGYDLVNCEEWRPMMQTLLAFDRGEAVTLPQSIQASPPG